MEGGKLNYGLQILELATRPRLSRWIKRRRESIRILNERSITRTSTLEIDVREVMRGNPPLVADHTLLLPVLRISRRVHTTVEVITQVDQPARRLTFAEERGLVAQGFRDAWGGVPIDLLRRAIKLIEDPYDHDKIHKSEGRSRSAAELETRDIIVELNRRKVLSAQEFRSFARSLLKWRDNYLLLLEVPILLDQRYATVVLRLSESIPSHGRKSKESGRWRKWLGILRGLIAGSFSVAMSIPMRYVAGSADSIHVELEAISGFRAVDPHVTVHYFAPDESDLTEEEICEVEIVRRRTREGLGPEQTFWDDDGVPETGHVYFTAPSLPVRDARFFVSLYAYRTGTVIESVLASWLVAAIMSAYFVRLSHWKFDASKAFPGASPNFAAVLLPAILSLVVAVIMTRDANRITSRSFWHLRFALGISTAGALVAAVLLALQDQGAGAAVLWWAIFGSSNLVAVKLTLGLIVHSWRISGVRGRWLVPIRRSQELRDRDAIDRVGIIAKRVSQRAIGVPKNEMAAILEPLGDVGYPGLSGWKYWLYRQGYPRSRATFPELLDVDEDVAEYSQIFAAMRLDAGNEQTRG